MLLHSGQYGFIGVWLQKIIGIHKGHIIAGHFLKGGVSGGAHPFVLLVDHQIAGILLCVFVTNGSAVICGAIVTKNDFQIGVGLPQQAVQALAQIGRNVVYRNNDGEFRSTVQIIPSRL